MTLKQTPRPTKAAYHLDCLRRLPAFTESVFEFHRKYPPVFVARDGLTPKVRWPKRWRLPVRAREDDGKGRVLVGTPQNAEEIEAVNGFSAELVLARWYRRLRPEDGDEYFTALGSGSRQEWDADFEELARRWPTVPRSCLRWPWTALFPRPQLLSPRQSMPDGVVVLIPVYADTTETEVDDAWKAAMEVRRGHLGKRGTQRRDRPNDYSKRLKVYDSYLRHRNYRAVAVELGIPESTVRDVYREAFFDIHGERLGNRGAERRPTTRERRAAGVNVSEIQTCQA